MNARVWIPFALLLWPWLCAASSPDDAVWLNLHLAALPERIDLCRDLGPDSAVELMIDEDGEYEWGAWIDSGDHGTQENPGYGGADAMLVIYTSGNYFWDCQPFQASTREVVKAELVTLGPAASGNYPFTRTALPLQFDFAHATISVRLDPHLVPGGLPATSKLSAFSAGIYESTQCSGSYACRFQKYAGDSMPALYRGTQLPSFVADARDDVSDCEPAGDWCRWLDIAGISLDAVPGAHALPVSTPPPSGNWYDRAHPGHGIDLQAFARDPAAGDGYFLVFFTFGAGGEPEWYVSADRLRDDRYPASSTQRDNAELWRPHYDSSKPAGQRAGVDAAHGGKVRIAFHQPPSHPACAGLERSGAVELAVMHWELDGTAADWCLEPALPAAAGTTPLNGHWFAPDDPGWGMEILQPNGANSWLAVSLFYADAAGNPRWATGVNTLSHDDYLDMGAAVDLREADGYCRTCAVPTPRTDHFVGRLHLYSGKTIIDLQRPDGSRFQRTDSLIRRLSLPPGQ